MNGLEVKCYSGHTYAERPRSFRWEGAEHNIDEIEKAWQEPGEKHFQVRAGANKLFHLCYNEMNRQWSAVELVGQGKENLKPFPSSGGGGGGGKNAERSTEDTGR